MEQGTKGLIYLFIFATLFVSLFNFLMYFGGFTGDPLIHARYAEMANQGSWFRFNADEPSSGVTSFFWLFLGAFGWLIGGIKGCLQLYKFVILISWLGSAGLLGILVYKWCRMKIFGVLAAVLFLGYPGVALNGLTGMENMTFSLFLLLFVYVYSLYADETRQSDRKTLWAFFLGILLGLQIITRPEGAFIALGFAGYEIWRAFNLPDKKKQKKTLRLFLLIVSVSSLIVFPVYGFHFLQTGKALPGSGLARMMAARRMPTSFHLFGPFWFFSRTILRLLSYLPVAIILVSVLYRTTAHKFNTNFGRKESFEHSDSHRFALLAAVLGIGLYTFVTGALHVNRYTIWILGISTAIFCSFLAGLFQHLRQSKRKLYTAGLFIGLLWMFLTQSGESIYRFIRKDHIKLAHVSAVVKAVNNRKEQTDNLLAQISAYQEIPQDRPMGILLQEVQIRLFYDARIQVFSRDGLISFLHFEKNGCPDFLSLLDNPNIDIIMDNLNTGTTKGCTGDENINKLVDLYENDQHIETEGWKKIWYFSYPKIVFWYQLKKDENKMPILLRKYENGKSQ